MATAAPHEQEPRPTEVALLLSFVGLFARWPNRRQASICAPLAMTRTERGHSGVRLAGDAGLPPGARCVASGGVTGGAVWPRRLGDVWHSACARTPQSEG